MLDEFRAQVPLNAIKILCDRYHVQTPFKGGFVPWSCDVVCFTSQHHPDDWWPGDPAVSTQDREAFASRCVIFRLRDSPEGRAHRIAEVRAALGEDLLRSLPEGAVEAPSAYGLPGGAPAGPAPQGRSSLLHLSGLPVQGGVPQVGLQVPQGALESLGVARVVANQALEARLTLLNPSYAQLQSLAHV